MLSLTFTVLYVLMIFITYPIFRGLWYGWSMYLIDELYQYSLSGIFVRSYKKKRQREELLENRLFSFVESLIWPIAFIAHSEDFKYFKGLIINNKLYKG